MIRYSWVLVSVAVVAAGTALLGQRAPVAARKGDGGPAIKAEINAPSSITIDAQDNIYVYESEGLDVRRIDGSTGIITTILEGCEEPWNKPHPAGCLSPIGDMKIDAAGNLVFAEFTYNRLSKFDLSNRTFSLIAGTGALKSSGDGETAINAGIPVSFCLDQDRAGNILICENSRIRKVDGKTGIVSTVAGHGERGFGGDGGPALDAKFGVLVSLAVDASDNLYVTDRPPRAIM